MESITDLGSGDNIVIGDVSAIQEVVGDCPHCRKRIKFPFGGGMVDYESLYKEMEYRIKQAVMYASEKSEENHKLRMKLHELQDKLNSPI